MNDEQILKASAIFEKPSAEWSKDDWAFLDSLVKIGFRSRLKELRREVENGQS